MRILIAEDDRTSCEYLSGVLSAYGECDTVFNGLEALDAYIMAMRDFRNYDLICLDVMMPKVDGVSVLKAIRDYEAQMGVIPTRRSKIMIISALAETRHLQSAINHGCDAYVMKPIEVDMLIETLKKMGLIKGGEDR